MLWDSRQFRDECRSIRGLVEELILRLEAGAVRDMARERGSLWEYVRLKGVVDRQRRMIDILMPHKIDFRNQAREEAEREKKG